MFENKLIKSEKRYEELEKLLSDPKVLKDPEKFKAYSKELGDLKDIVVKFGEHKSVQKELSDAKEMLADKEMRELAAKEVDRLESRAEALKKDLEVLMIPKDPSDEKSIFLEVRAGTGGEEAAIFAGNLVRMYLRYAERQGWKTEMISENATGLGGFKEAIFGIYGKGAYSRLKFESGTHRVQRVPTTESGGRIHTSAATVAVMPEAEDVDLKIEDKDLRIDTFRSSGPGGQSVNKTSSAIRITHIPSGLVVACQEERSQHKNKAKAMKLLRSRLLDQMEEKQRSKRAEQRKVQVGTGDRSEKIRTYNFPQSRVTDHRIGFSVHNLNQVLDGEMDEVIDALTVADRAKKLEKMK
jgi:peptide chain release factor 1